MKVDVAPPIAEAARHVAADDLARFCRTILQRAGASDATAEAATSAMMHASTHGIDSHGVRLLDHYVRVIVGGRVNGEPNMRWVGVRGATATLDADHAHGALATYAAMDRAVELAHQFGLGSVAVRNSSHFGPAGAYALTAAQKGLIGITVCNSDSFVRLHGGSQAYHGTNPIAMAAPSGAKHPWLFDMATSAIPYNRIILHRSLHAPLPEGVASSDDGHDAVDAQLATVLAPLGGAFGYKGAGLAGMAEIFSAVLTGMQLSCELLPMEGEDLSTPRSMGAWVLAVDPEMFIGRARFEDAMQRYLKSLRASPAMEGQRVMAPGDREWTEAERRERTGIPLDPATLEAFEALSQAFDCPAPASFGDKQSTQNQNEPRAKGVKSDG